MYRSVFLILKYKNQIPYGSVFIMYIYSISHLKQISKNEIQFTFFLLFPLVGFTQNINKSEITVHDFCDTIPLNILAKK
jgi:hypothetical protein